MSHGRKNVKNINGENVFYDTIPLNHSPFRGIMYILKIGQYEVIFDSEKDYDLVTLHKLKKSKRRKIWVDDNIKNKPYALISYNGKNVRVHHILAGYPLNKRMVDHFNGNSLDNRRDNLRVVTRSENGYNKPSRNNHRWITKQKSGRYTVTVRWGLGTFDDIEDAKKAVEKFLKEKEIKIFKGFYE